MGSKPAVCGVLCLYGVLKKAIRGQTLVNFEVISDRTERPRFSGADEIVDMLFCSSVADHVALLCGTVGTHSSGSSGFESHSSLF